MARSDEQVRLLRGLAHEVGNALAAIRLTGHLAVAEPDPNLPAAMDDIDRTCARASALMAQIRPLLTPGCEAERSGLGAEEILTALGRALPAEGVTWVEPGAGLPGVRADAEALHQLALMLALGALERGRPGGGLRIEARAEGAELVLVLVSDRENAASEIELEIAAAVLARDAGRLAVRSGPEGTRLELRLPARP